MQANIWKYYLFHFFLNFQLWWPIWIIYLTEERGLTLGQVTLIDVPFWLSIIVLQIPAAAIADRWGRKPTLLASATAFAAAVTFFGLATNFWLILGSYLVWGVAFALLSGTESAFIYDSLKAMGRESEYARIYGRGWAVATVGGLTGTLLGAPIADATSLPFPIVLSGGLAFFAAVAAFTFREPLIRDRETPHPSYAGIIGQSLGIVKRQPAVRYALMYFGLITMGSIGTVFFFQPFLVEHDVDLGQVGIWQTPMRVAGVIGALAAHRLISGLGERRTFYGMAVLLVASYALLASWDSVYAQVAFPVMNAMVVLSQPTVTNYLNHRVPSEQRATVISLTNLMRSAILIPSAPLLGALAESSLLTAFMVGGGIIAVLGVPLLVLWTRHLDQEEAGEPVAAEPVPARD
ncbi:MAG TPA: MFS transporter [Dehalococcoidia bacterium]|nr:MFS transporter [Dehalococcoidia bacterium]